MALRGRLAPPAARPPGWRSRPRPHQSGPAPPTGRHRETAQISRQHLGGGKGRAETGAGRRARGEGQRVRGGNRGQPRVKCGRVLVLSLLPVPVSLPPTSGCWLTPNSSSSPKAPERRPWRGLTAHGGPSPGRPGRPAAPPRGAPLLRAGRRLPAAPRSPPGLRLLLLLASGGG